MSGIALLLALASQSRAAVMNIPWVRNGTAVPGPNGTTVLTQNAANQAGSMWNPCTFDMATTNFDMCFDMNFGANECGADGMTFTLQSNNTAALGADSGEHGYSGIGNSLAIALDTYSNPGSPYYDPAFHTFNLNRDGGTAFEGPGNATCPGYFGSGWATGSCRNNASASLPLISDGQWHSVCFHWNASTRALSFDFDGVGRALWNLPSDYVTSAFGGNSNVYYGFTGSTGGATNYQQVRQTSSTLPTCSVATPTSDSYTPIPLPTVACGTPIPTFTPPGPTNTPTVTPTAYPTVCGATPAFVQSLVVNGVGQPNANGCAGSGAPTSWPYTVPAGPGQVLIVQVEANGFTISSGVTYNGTALTALPSNASVAIPGGGNIYSFYMVNPPVGSFTLAVPGASGCSWNVVATVYKNIDTASPFGAISTNSGTLATFSDSITTTTGYSIVHDFFAYPSGPQTFGGSYGTQLFAANTSQCCNDVYGSYTNTSAPGSYTNNYTDPGGSTNWRGVSIELRPVTSCSTPTFTRTSTPTYTRTNTVNPTSTSTDTPSDTPSVTPSFTGTVTPSVTPSSTSTRTVTASATPSDTPSVTPSRTSTLTPSDTPSVTPSSTRTVTPSVSPSSTDSPTQTQTTLNTSTDTPTRTVTASVTPSSTSSATASDTRTLTQTYTPSLTPSSTASTTATPSQTQTSTVTDTRSVTPSDTTTPTQTITSLNTRTDTSTSTSTLTITQTSTLTATPSATPSSTVSFTQTITTLNTRTDTPTLTVTLTITPSRTATPTQSITSLNTSTDTATQTLTLTVTPTYSQTATLSDSPTAPGTFTDTPSRTVTPTSSFTATNSPVNSFTSTHTVTLSRTVTPSSTETATATSTRTATSSFTFSPTQSASPTQSPTFTPRPTPIPAPLQVSVAIYNSAGERVKVIYQGPAQSVSASPQALPVSSLAGGPISVDIQGIVTGSGTLHWDGQNDNGQWVSSGMYYLQTTTTDNFGSTTTLSSSVPVLGAPRMASLEVYNSAGELVRSLTLNGLAALPTDLSIPDKAFVGGQGNVGASSPGTGLRVDLKLGNAGTQQLTWDGLSDSGQPLASGTYVMKLAYNEAGQRTVVKTVSVSLLQDPNSPAQAAVASAFLGPNPWKPSSGQALKLYYKPSTQGRAGVRVYNLSGELVAQASDPGNSGCIGLPLFGAEGIYLVDFEMRSGNAVLARRVLKAALVR